MTDKEERKGSEIGHLVGGIVKGMKMIMSYMVFGGLAILGLTALMGGGNGASVLAILIVIGAEIGLHRYRKRKFGVFGDTARGTQVSDHTQEGP
ncbi:hypothetical protein A9R16_003440 [Acidiferrobacter thiooxydans]|uniref:hypothetical protein n=1 Tax=Acidiferrobacter thiooxydans TaxID=163359 RepID=UPI0008253F27|nr:hypothetical protein [Acidiferrobacter thiooxydans]UEO00468.1 hypothetical protein A9R16_003440 [Acidiferrobacter thiooxydans]